MSPRYGSAASTSGRDRRLNRTVANSTAAPSWRGPIWVPLNFSSSRVVRNLSTIMLTASRSNVPRCPANSSRFRQVAADPTGSLGRLFLKGADGQRRYYNISRDRQPIHISGTPIYFTSIFSKTTGVVAAQPIRLGGPAHRDAAALTHKSSSGISRVARTPEPHLEISPSQSCPAHVSSPVIGSIEKYELQRWIITY